MHEITLKVIRSIEQFEDRSSLVTWVTRIADNHCSSFVKRRSAKAMTTHLQYDLSIFESDRYQQAEPVTDDQTSVQRTLTALSEMNREILELRCLADISLEEIGQSLDLSLSATKMRLYRALAVFKKQHCIEML